MKIEKQSFEKHPSKLLNDLYKESNHQGARPDLAKFIFVGRDPNWAFNIETQDMFGKVLEYLSDGVRFWEKYKIHHPFLLPNYKGDGKRYHKIFSKLKIDSEWAHLISFVELIGFPTTGMAKSSNKKFMEYLMSDENKSHLIRLDQILNNPEKIIFIAWGLIEDFKYLNKKTGLFLNFSQLDKNKMVITDLNIVNNIFIHRHFSDAISNTTLEKMKSQFDIYLNKTI